MRRERGLKAKGYAFARRFTSVLTRAEHTLKIMLRNWARPGLPESRDQAMDERDDGEPPASTRTMPAEVGEEQVQMWRRPMTCPARRREPEGDAGRRRPFT